MKHWSGSALLSVVVLLTVVMMVSLWQLRTYQQFASQYREQIKLNNIRLHELMREKYEK